MMKRWTAWILVLGILLGIPGMGLAEGFDTNAESQHTITLTVSAHEILADDSVLVEVSAPGADAIQLYYNGSPSSEGAGETLSVRWGIGGTTTFFAVASYNGVWSENRSNAETVTVVEKGQLDPPIFKCPNSIRAGELLTIQTTAMENPSPEHDYDTVLYSFLIRDSNGSQVTYESARSGESVTIQYIFTPGNYTVYAMSRTTNKSGFSAGDAVAYFTVTEEALKPFTVTLLSNPDELQGGDPLTFRVEMEGAVTFIAKEEHGYECGSFSATNGSAECTVQGYGYSTYNNSSHTGIFFEAILENGETVRSLTTTVNFGLYYAPPTISCPSELQLGKNLTVTVTNIPDIAEFVILGINKVGDHYSSIGENGFIYSNDFVNGSASYTFDEKLFQEGTYQIWADYSVKENGKTSGPAFTNVSIRGQRNPEPTVTAHKNEFYFDEDLSFHVSAPGADAISWEAQLKNSSWSSPSEKIELDDDGSAEIVTNVLRGLKPDEQIGTLTLTARAYYNGVSSEPTTVQVEVKSLGQLADPVVTLSGTAYAGKDLAVYYTKSTNAERYALEYSFQNSTWAYSLNGSGGFTIPGDTLVESEDSYKIRVVATAEHYFPGEGTLEFTVQPYTTVVNISANKFEAMVDETVTFTISSNVEKVDFVVDGTSCGEIAISDNTATFDYAFLQKGKHNVSIVAPDETKSNIIQINVIPKGKLDKAQITLPTEVEQGKTVEASWTIVDNADEYTASLKNDQGIEIWQQSTEENKTVIPADLLTANKQYTFFVLATSAAYESSENSAVFTVVPPSEISFIANTTDVEIDEEVTFSITANVPSVRFVVDGVAYEEIEIKDGTATFKRAFSETGNREISFVAADGTSSESTVIVVRQKSLKGLSVYIPEILDEVEGAVASWSDVDHAEKFVFQLYSDTTELLWEQETAETTLAIPSDKLSYGERYIAYVTASGEGYVACSASANFEVKGKRKGPSFTMSPTTIKGGAEYTTLTVTAEGATDAAYYVISPAGGSFQFRNSHPLTDGTVSIQASFSGEGIYTIAFMAKYDGAWSELGPSQELTVLKADDIEAGQETPIKPDVYFRIVGNGIYPWKGDDGSLLGDHYLVYIQEPCTLSVTGNAHDKVNICVGGSPVGTLPFGDGYASMSYTFTAVGDYSLYGDLQDGNEVVGRTLEKNVHARKRTLDAFSFIEVPDELTVGDGSTITWQSVQEAEGYTLAITAPDGQKTTFETTDTSYTINENTVFSQAGNYQIEVTAHAEYRESSTATHTCVCKENAKEKLAGPVITSPSAGAELESTSFALSWNAVDGADHYIYALRDTTTDELIIGTTETTGRSVNLTAPIKGHSYRAAVGAVPAGEANNSELVGWAEVTFSVKAQEDQTCTHPTTDTMWDTNYSISYRSISDTEHEASGYQYRYCTVCLERLGDSFSATKTLPHDFDAAGDCPTCGYSHGCKHENTRFVLEEGYPVYTPENEQTHIYDAQYKEVCTNPSCGKTIRHFVDSQRVYEHQAHNFDAAGKCKQCGYVKKASQEDLDVMVIRGESSAETGETISASAQVSGGDGNYRYAWTVYLNGVSIQKTDYSKDDSFSIVAAEPGTYLFLVTIVDGSGHSKTVASQSITVRTARCTHPAATVFSGEVSYTQVSDAKHLKSTQMIRVCDVCGETIDEYNKEESEDHTFVNGRCTGCGFAEPKPECKHAHTEERLTDSAITGQGDTSQHIVTETYAVVCLDCGETIRSFEKRVLENHSFNADGVCACGYAQPTPECDHANRVEIEVGEPTYVNNGEKGHTKTLTVRMECADCGITLEEAKTVTKPEQHAFVNGFCVCGQAEHVHHYEKITVGEPQYINQNDEMHTVVTTYYEYCAECGDTTEQKTKEENVPHTFDYEGYEAAHPHQYFKRCSACGCAPKIPDKYYTANGTVQDPAQCCICHGHKWSEPKYIGGSYKIVCEYCGLEKDAEHVHTFGEPQFKPEHPHQYYQVCSECGEKKFLDGQYYTVSADGKVQSGNNCCVCNGHQWGESKIVDGKWITVCSNCGAIKDHEHVFSVVTTIDNMYSPYDNSYHYISSYREQLSCIICGERKVATHNIPRDMHGILEPHTYLGGICPVCSYNCPHDFSKGSYCSICNMLNSDDPCANGHSRYSKILDLRDSHADQHSIVVLCPDCGQTIKKSFAPKRDCKECNPNNAIGAQLNHNLSAYLTNNGQKELNAFLDGLFKDIADMPYQIDAKSAIEELETFANKLVIDEEHLIALIERAAIYYEKGFLSSDKIEEYYDYLLATWKITVNNSELPRDNLRILALADSYLQSSKRAYDTDYEEGKSYNQPNYSTIIQISENKLYLGDNNTEKSEIMYRTEYPDCLIEPYVSADGKKIVRFSFEGSSGGDMTGILSLLEYIFAPTEENRHKADESLRDWILTDYTVWESANGIHSGFDTAIQQFLKELKNVPCNNIAFNCSNIFELLLYAKEHPDDIEIQVTGHSLGGALAQVFTYYLLTNFHIDKSQITTYTFASPVPFTNEALKGEVFDDLNVYNFINIRDAVPKYGVVKYDFIDAISGNDPIKDALKETAMNFASNLAEMIMYDCGAKDATPGGFTISGTNMGTNIYMAGAKAHDIGEEHKLENYDSLINGRETEWHFVDTRKR